MKLEGCSQVSRAPTAVPGLLRSPARLWEAPGQQGRAELTCLGFPLKNPIPDFLHERQGEEYSYVFQGLIQQLRASVDFSRSLAPA